MSERAQRARVPPVSEELRVLCRNNEEFGLVHQARMDLWEHVRPCIEALEEYVAMEEALRGPGTTKGRVDQCLVQARAALGALYKEAAR